MLIYTEMGMIVMKEVVYAHTFLETGTSQRATRRRPGWVRSGGKRGEESMVHSFYCVFNRKDKAG